MWCCWSCTQWLGLCSSEQYNRQLNALQMRLTIQMLAQLLDQANLRFLKCDQRKCFSYPSSQLSTNLAWSHTKESRSPSHAMWRLAAFCLWSAPTQTQACPKASRPLLQQTLPNLNPLGMKYRLGNVCESRHLYQLCQAITNGSTKSGSRHHLDAKQHRHGYWWSQAIHGASSHPLVLDKPLCGRKIASPCLMRNLNRPNLLIRHESSDQWCPENPPLSS